jgi:hypothetical protein
MGWFVLGGATGDLQGGIMPVSFFVATALAAVYGYAGVMV